MFVLQPDRPHDSCNFHFVCVDAGLSKPAADPDGQQTPSRLSFAGSLRPTVTTLSGGRHGSGLPDAGVARAGARVFATAGRRGDPHDAQDGPTWLLAQLRKLSLGHGAHRPTARHRPDARWRCRLGSLAGACACQRRPRRRPAGCISRLQAAPVGAGDGGHNRRGGARTPDSSRRYGPRTTSARRSTPTCARCTPIARATATPLPSKSRTCRRTLCWHAGQLGAYHSNLLAWPLRHRPNVIVIWFEDMLAANAAALRQLAAFVGVELSSYLEEDALRRTSFDSMAHSPAFVNVHPGTSKGGYSYSGWPRPRAADGGRGCRAR